MSKVSLLKVVSDVICSKDSLITYNECYENSKKNGGICYNYDNCIIEEKSIEQLSYIVSSKKDNIYLEACPGSGKTEVVGIKTAYEISQWNKENSGIAILSFTNNSADVIKDRASKFLGSGSTSYPHFIGTIDSWLHSYIAQPFGHHITEYLGKDTDKKITLVDESSFALWLNSLDTFTYYYRKKGSPSNQSTQVLPNQISYDVENEKWIIKLPFRGTNNYITAQEHYDSEAVQEFVKTHKWYKVKHINDKLEDCKLSFLKKGYATYKDIEVICFDIIYHCKDIAKRIAKRFPFIIIDEAQDLSWIQIEIFKELQTLGVTIHTIGDLNQAIYSFKKVNPENFETYISKDFSKQKLNTNYRSCEAIITTCSNMLNIDSSNYFYTNDIKKPCLLYTYDEDKIDEISQGYVNVLDEYNIPIDKSAILSRGWGLIRKISNAKSQDLEKAPFLLATLMRIYSPSDVQNLKYSLELLGKILSIILLKKSNCSKQHFYKPDSIESNIMWRKFLYNLLKKLLDTTDIADLSLNWSKWCSAVNKSFISIVKKSAIECRIYEQIEKEIDVYSYKYRSPNGYAKETVNTIEVATSEETMRLRKTTIHQVKGETLSSVLLVSTEKSNGSGEGYWKKWLENPDKEIGRFAYVASSRPKDLLVWAIPKKSIADIKILEDIGFEYKGQIN